MRDSPGNKVLWVGAALIVVACGSNEPSDVPESGVPTDARFDRYADITVSSDGREASAPDAVRTDVPSDASGGGGTGGAGGNGGIGGAAGNATQDGAAGSAGFGGSAGSGGSAGTAGVGGTGAGGAGAEDAAADAGADGTGTGGAGGAAGSDSSDGGYDAVVDASVDATDGAGGSSSDDAGPDVSAESGADGSADGAVDTNAPEGSADGSGASEGGGDTASQIAVTVCPKKTVLLAGESMAFTADVTGTGNASLFYGIVGGTSGGGSDSGSVDRGTIDGAGVYTAPSIPGSYDVVVKSQADPSKSDTATVTVVASNAVPTVRGVITAPPGTGRVFVTVKEWQGGGTMLASPGPYVIRGLAIDPSTTNITVVAYRDTADVGTYISSVDAIGQTVVSWNGSSATGVDFGLADPPPPSFAQAPTLAAWPVNGGAVLKWERLKDAIGNELPQYYRLYASATPNPGPDAGTSVVKTVRAGVVDAAVMAPLSNGTPFYFAVSAVTGTTESPLSPVVGPVTIGTPTGGHTARGTVSFDFPAQGSLYVWAVAGSKGIWSQKIANPQSPQSFAVSGLPDGRYDLAAVFDVDDDGEIDPDEPGTFRRQEGSPLLVVAGAEVANLSLSLPGTDGMAWTSTQYRRDGTNNPDYEVRLSAATNLRRVVKTVIIGGPGVVPPIDLPTQGENVYQWQVKAGQVPPAVGGTYDFEVTYENGRTCNLSAAVTGVWTSLPTALQPSGPDAGSATPTFTWLSPSVTPPSFWYRLNVWEMGGGSGDVWYAGLPSSFNSIVYNDDGRASVAALISGKQYQWVVYASDPAGNIAAHRISFGVP